MHYHVTKLANILRFSSCLVEANLYRRDYWIHQSKMMWHFKKATRTCIHFCLNKLAQTCDNYMKHSDIITCRHKQFLFSLLTLENSPQLSCSSCVYEMKSANCRLVSLTVPWSVAVCSGYPPNHVTYFWVQLPAMWLQRCHRLPNNTHNEIWEEDREGLFNKCGKEDEVRGQREK